MEKEVDEEVKKWLKGSDAVGSMKETKDTDVRKMLV